jgi:hypothetical protein
MIKIYYVNNHPGRTRRHVKGRIQLKYDHFLPENGDRIRRSFTMLNHLRLAHQKDRHLLEVLCI